MYLHNRVQQGLLALATGLVVAGAAFAAPLPATQLAPLQAMIASSSGSAAVSRSAAAFAVSRPVREIPARPYRDVDPNRILPGPWNPMIPKARLKQTILPYGDLDAAIAKAPLAPSVMPPTIQNFEGMSNAANGQLFAGFIFPPDTVGDIGRAHYVQAVNLAVQVFRTDGLALTPPFKMSDLFAALGPDNVCATTDNGDPIVLYDQMADRWLISQFAVVGPPFHQCIAISQTADPTGAYNVYDFVMPNDKFNDYPHFGVWPDGYYMTDNQFNLDTGDFLDGGAFAFDRTKMLAGDPSASYIYFDMAVLFPGQFIGGMLPADLDGVPPATPRPNVLTYFTANEFGDPQGDALRLFEFVPNFATPASSTFTELPFVPVAAFDPANNGTRNDIPQPPPATIPSQNLDSISDRVLHRLQYRNFGTHESMVVNHSVDVDPAATLRFGVRYYELRRTLPGGSWTVHEQATQAPGTDTENRWMGSAAMDRAGNLAVGFSVSNATTFPSIRYAGRLATDPPGSLAQGEATIIAGSSSQRDSRARWGDYSSLNVDPVDDCTFWYTTEYFTNTPPAMCASTICWQTRIASFRFPSCPAAPLQREITGQVTNGITGLPVSGVTVLAGNGFAATTDSSGNYRISIPPGTYAMATAKTGYGAATASGVVVPVPAVPNPPNPVRNFQIVGVPLLQIGASNASDAGRGGNANGVFDLDECPTINPAANNIGGGIATNTTGVLTTTTPDVTVPSSTANYGSINPGASAFPSSPFVIQTSPTFAVGQPIDLALTLTSAEGSWVQNYTLSTGQPVPLPPTGLTPPAPVPVPDDTPAGVNITVPVAGIGLPVLDVRVALRMTHSWIGDIAITLTSPNGVTTEVTGSIGGAGNSADNAGTNCPATDGNDLIYSDSAAQPPPAGVNNVSGVFRPDNPLSVFRGLPAATANGNWVLNFRDTFFLDTGAVQCVAIFIDGVTSVSGNCAALSVDDLFANGFEEPVP